MNNNNNNNTTSLPYSVALFKVNPIDPSSKLSHANPGEELFTDRNEFLSFGHQTHLATLVTLLNEHVFNDAPRRRSFTANITITARSSDTLNPITSRSASVKFTRDSLYQTIRLDLPMEYSEVDEHPAHIVDITDSDSGELLLRRKIALWRLPFIKKLPTRWFSVDEAWLAEPFAFSPQHYRSVGCDYSHRDVTVKFALNLCADRNLFPFAPELQMRLFAPDGSCSIHAVRPAQIDDASATDDCTFSVQRLFTLGKDKGVHYCELLCMGHAFAGFLFNNAEPSLDGHWAHGSLAVLRDYTPELGRREWNNLMRKMHKDEMERRAANAVTATAASSRLDALIGLDEVKGKVLAQACTARFNSLRREHGLPMVFAPLHSIFMGSPGTGKTTVAKILGEELQKAGVLSRGHVVMRERSTLVGRYYGDEEKATREALEEARGGILFIDEAYQLHQPDDPRDPGKFVIETLMTALADEDNRDWMLILAGYTGKMERLFDINPGLRSRIPDSNVYHFYDYTCDELMEIALRYLHSNHFLLGDDSLEALSARISADYATRTEAFGNARYVMNLITTEILPAMARRIASIAVPETSDLQLILPDDIPAAVARPQIITPRIGFAV